MQALEDRELVIQYIHNLQECDYVDFKEKFYIIKHDKESFIKDIVSFANNQQLKDKYIIFGVEDKGRYVCGVDLNTIPDVAILESLLLQKVEPQITIKLDSFLFDNKQIAYIKVPFKNENLPYVIKNECGSVKQGDIYIRKGTINTKANRKDIDEMYLGRQLQQVIPYDDNIFIEPISSVDSLVKNPIYGIIQIEITNVSHYPLLINEGWIEIENKFGKVEHRINHILPNRNITDNPVEVAPNSRFKRTALFSFLSSDCITLHFDDEGNLFVKTLVKTIFKDVNGKIFESEPKDFFIKAQGDILHKIKRMYNDFRKYLKEKRKTILKAIELNQEETLKQLFYEPYMDLGLLQPVYVMSNPEYPEYDICAEIIQTANNLKNYYVIELMQKRGLPKDFIEFALGHDKD